MTADQSDSEYEDECRALVQQERCEQAYRTLLRRHPHPLDPEHPESDDDCMH